MADRIVAKQAGVLTAGDTVKTARQSLRDHDANLWPVVDGRKVVGMIQGRRESPPPFDAMALARRVGVKCADRD